MGLIESAISLLDSQSLKMMFFWLFKSLFLFCPGLNICFFMFCHNPLVSIMNSSFPIVFSVFRSDLKEVVNRGVMAASADDTKLFSVLKMNADWRESGLEGCFVWPQRGFFCVLNFWIAIVFLLSISCLGLTKACLFPLRLFLVF